MSTCMLGVPSMLRVKLPNDDRIHQQSNKIAMGVENKATGHSKRDDSPTLEFFSTSKYVETQLQWLQSERLSALFVICCVALFHKHLFSLFIFFCRSPKRGLTVMKHLKRLHMKKWWHFKEAIRT